MKIVVLSPKSKTVYNFRGELIRDMVKKGSEVTVVAPDDIYSEEIKSLGVTEIITLPFVKDNTSVIGDIRYFLGLKKILKKLRPDIVFSYTIKPVIYGSVAARSSGVSKIYPMITGKELSSKAAGYVSRLLTIMTLVLAFIACLFAKDVMSYITNVIGSIIPGVSVAMVFGALYKKASWQSGVAAIVSGLLFGVSFLAIDSFNAYIKEVFSGPAIPATIVAVVCALVVALVTGKEKLSEQERLNIVYASRGKSHE